MRGIRPIVLNRKNALFAGHDHGAENRVCIAALIESCKLTGVDPRAYFTDVLMKLVSFWPAARINELMRWGRATFGGETRGPMLRGVKGPLTS